MNEIQTIRSTAHSALMDAHKLTGDVNASIFVRAEDKAWDAVRFNDTYSEFSSTFRQGINSCNKRGKFLASGRLHKGLDEISDAFLLVYNKCILNHHNYKSFFERGKIHFDKGNIEECLSDVAVIVNAGVSNQLVKDIKITELMMMQGRAFLEIGQYEKAIQALSTAIENDSKNKQAYFHRAIAYFETGNFDQSLQDYLSSDKGKDNPKPTYQAPKEFTEALVNSACQGATEAIVDFVPSLCNSAYGLAETLWVTAQHPIENTGAFANACYEIGECVVEQCKTIDWNTMDNCVDQVKTLYENFDQLKDAEKGELIGYVIGKYGIDIFAGSALMKGVSAYRNLRDANRICNLEAMAISNANKEKVVSSAFHHASERNSFFKNIGIEWEKQNKHVVGKHNYNPTKSILEHEDPNRLLRSFGGKGKVIRGNIGEAGYQEIVDFGEFIGFNVCEQTGMKTPTTWGKIHYSKNGAHIVPTMPRK